MMGCGSTGRCSQGRCMSVQHALAPLAPVKSSSPAPPLHRDMHASLAVYQEALYCRLQCPALKSQNGLGDRAMHAGTLPSGSPVDPVTTRPLRAASGCGIRRTMSWLFQPHVEGQTRLKGYLTTLHTQGNLITGKLEMDAFLGGSRIRRIP
ncbi:hypothetical protein NDU88_000812 [Pleurodeles waltl]|uniref:Uncharacterized protein n=1 Tax=Pleurodeles waltl TaxID=8319 RepID=A0AAV7VXM0_PLEWA|nr:hypothetical protein NDU88_000812 [Pleurodeles waltl]